MADCYGYPPQWQMVNSTYSSPNSTIVYTTPPDSPYSYGFYASTPISPYILPSQVHSLSAYGYSIPTQASYGTPVTTNNGTQMASNCGAPVLVAQMPTSRPSAPIQLPCAYDHAGIVASLLNGPVENFVRFASTNDGAQMMLDYFPKKPELRTLLYEKVIQNNLFVPMAMGANSNRVMQELVIQAGQYTAYIAMIISRNIVKLFCDKYAFSVMKKAVDKFPLGQLFAIVDACRHSEVYLANDHYGTRVIHRIVERKSVAAFEPLVLVYAKPENLHALVQSKCGYRIVQRLIDRLQNWASQPRENADKNAQSTALNLLDKLLTSIVQNSCSLVTHEYGNFVIQQVLCSQHHARIATSILKNSVLGRVLSLSQDRYGSRVLEAVLITAPPNTLVAVCKEILEGYEDDIHGRHAVEIMLFDIYANYVLQTLLRVTFLVANGAREGNPEWFQMLKKHITGAESRLRKFTHGVIMLDLLESLQL